MNDYKVKITEHAMSQITEILTYIADSLHTPQAADAWAEKLQTLILGLSNMPNRYPPVTTEPWHTEGVRKTSVGHFIVYYRVYEQTVWIIAVIYEKRNQLEELKKIPTP